MHKLGDLMQSRVKALRETNPAMNRIQSEKITLVEIEKIIPNEKNMNKHSKEQLERLADIIRYQGFRVPLMVSNRSGKLVCGHARLDVAKKLGFKKVPVMYQDFEDEEQEYAAMVSENAIQSWSELDFSLVNMEIENLGPDFDIDLLGIKDFELEPLDKIDFQDKKNDKTKELKDCPNCGFKFK